MPKPVAQPHFFLIIGLGSIGKRHLENLLHLGYKNIIIVSRSEVPAAFSSFRCYKKTSVALAENTISHAFICTPTAAHTEDLSLLLQHEIPNIYLEKPISHNLDGIDEIRSMAHKCKRLVVGYDLHFDPGIAKIKSVLTENDLGKIHTINAVVGQFLPDWRPHQDHRNGMSAKMAKGGGVMLDLIHEFDYVRWLAGKPEFIAAISQHNPSLEIETEDVADVLIGFEDNIAATIHLDYHQKSLVRNCMITCEKGSIFWDLTLSEVRIVTKENTSLFSYSGFDRNDRYIAILQAFLNESVADDKLTGFDDALISLKMVVAAKESSRSKRFMTIN